MGHLALLYYLRAFVLYDAFELFALPSYFLLINLLAIVLCFRTPNQPPFLAGQGPPEHLRPEPPAGRGQRYAKAVQCSSTTGSSP